MLIKTKHFGEIELDEDKVITFEDGIMGFKEFTKFTLLYDNEEGEDTIIRWMQSIEEPGLALPVISPYFIKQDYSPIVEDELLKKLGDIQSEEELFILLALTIPKDMKEISANLKAPFIIHSSTRKGCQVIADNQDYEIKYKIYEILQSKNRKKEED